MKIQDALKATGKAKLPHYENTAYSYIRDNMLVYQHNNNHVNNGYEYILRDDWEPYYGNIVCMACKLKVDVENLITYNKTIIDSLVFLLADKCTCEE